LCGHDEALPYGASTFESVAFLDRLLVKVPGTSVEPGRAKELAICDCDRLFAAIYLHYFGEHIEGTARCRNCGEPFESSFSLRDLMTSIEDSATATTMSPDENGMFTLPDGRRFRLPTPGDQYEVMGLDAKQAATALLERCLVEGDPAQDPQMIQMAMDEAGPLLDLDIQAACPHCGASESVRFDIQTYLLAALAYEKRFLHHEVHFIAMAYGWRYEEILNLTREDRRAFVRLIAADAGVRKGGGV
jgi:hypothetical protein